jgi:eukaryotic-like serine/threonine-protein kinase
MHAVNASMTGRMLAHYRVESMAGTGGMGAVYRAYDTRLRRHVAIKLLTGTGQDDPGRRAVLREARAASRLNHPNICAVYEVGEADGQPFIVMELVEGRILSGIVAAGSLPVETVLHVGMQVADALDHAHGHGIVHRDLKPGNVAMTAEGRVKILDFGIAAALPHPDGAGDTIEATRTAAGAIAGTPAYMSPEAFRGESPRESADIWALGVLLYEMATGRRPFRGESAAELVSAILRDPVTVPAELPVGLRPVVLRCLQKEPAQRYGSAGEVRAALEAVAATLEHEAPGRRGAPSVWETPAPTLIAVAVALLLATAGAALWWGSRSPDSLEPANFRLLSTFPGAHRSATLSPDGGQLAFLDVEQEVPQVWVKNLREGDPIQVTSGSVPALRPRWVPAGDRIVFARRGAGIWEVSSLGGPERRLIDEGANPHLSADGRLMVFERGVEIWIAAADGSGERRVDGVPQRAYTVDLSPAISPDGSLIAFFVSEIGPNGDFWVISSAGGEARRLTHDVTEGGTPDFSPNAGARRAQRGDRALDVGDSQRGDRASGRRARGLRAAGPPAAGVARVRSGHGSGGRSSAVAVRLELVG